MSTQTLPTQFAPAERASPGRLVWQSTQVIGQPLIRPLLDAIPDVVFVLNNERQIVFANRALLDITRLDDYTAVIGLRPGEILDCVHATETEGGCGTTQVCATCGAAQAILSSLRGLEAVQECRISRKNGDALDLQVYATPLLLDGQTYTFFVLKDISHEKRRRMLEHVFFHDILNSAGALRGLADVLRRAPLEDKDEIAADVYTVCDRLIDEIKSQKVIAAAENNELHTERSMIATRQFLEEVIHFYQEHEAARGKQIVIDPQSCEQTIISDRALLRRVLGNMVKNALEACQRKETVTLGCRKRKDQIEFWVHNPGIIPDEVRLQIFQRSFSTKGAGRGLGTYSIKLLGERYLHGTVSFSSSSEQGTVFQISLPL